MCAASKLFVSIVMPALNEEDYIESAIDSITPCSEDIDYELIVVDGGSSDRTRSIVQRLSESNERIRIISNERRIQSAAVNIGARVADPSSRYLIRADCHSKYPSRFVESCIKTLVEKQAASVVVSMRTRGKTRLQKAIAAAQNSQIGNGGSAHRLHSGRSGFVDHGHHAAFDRLLFLDMGGYDESFSHNEDAEFDARLTRSGHNIYLNGDIRIDYFPRPDLKSLSRQYFNFGSGRAKMLLKHRVAPKIRQLIPVGAFLTCILGLALSLFDALFFVPALLYAGLCMFWGLGLAVKHKEPCLLCAGPAAMLMHMSWALGFLHRVVGFGLGWIWDAQPLIPAKPGLAKGAASSSLGQGYSQSGRTTQSD